MAAVYLQQVSFQARCRDRETFTLTVLVSFWPLPFADVCQLLAVYRSRDSAKAIS